ncbi:MAG: ABC transporter ATP-binding protein/permease [Lachnospiraceae bacterium]|nr:ABC transporter ATP-binding protein/permease [Lachnospiraceae bacterium]
MLRKMYNFSKPIENAIMKASALLGLFQFVCILPLILLVDIFDKMYKSYVLGEAFNVNISVYMITGTVLILLLFICYKKMYRIKYISAASENLNMRMSIMDKLRKLPQSYLSKHDLSDLTSTVMDDMGIIEGVLANQLTEMIGGFISIAAVLTVMFFVNVRMTLVLCVVLPLAAFAMGMSDKVSGKTHLKNRKIKLTISDLIQEYLENITVLKTSGSINEYQTKIKRTLNGLIPRLVLFEFLAGICVSTAYNLLRFGIGIVAVYGIGLLVKGDISVTTYVAYMLLSVWIYEPLSYTCEHLGAVIASKVAAVRIKDIMDAKEQTGDEDINVSNYDIVFDKVDFAYDEGSETVLNNVSFMAKQGEYTALVGASGSGKSTVCRLAARLWDVNKGTVTIGGQDISKVAPENLFKVFSIVFQDVTLFNDTIYNNILIGNKNATREQVLKAAEDAMCLSFIEKLPEGIDTVIGENGHTLSGGERQRLSIARALLKDAPIVLLDESTASVDPETETGIQEAIERLAKGRTVLMIAHRLRSIVNCNRIVVLDEGRVIGNGTHEELMKECSEYKKLYELQCE